MIKGGCEDPCHSHTIVLAAEASEPEPVDNGDENP